MKKLFFIVVLVSLSISFCAFSPNNSSENTYTCSEMRTHNSSYFSQFFDMICPNGDAYFLLTIDASTSEYEFEIEASHINGSDIYQGVASEKNITATYTDYEIEVVHNGSLYEIVYRVLVSGDIEWVTVYKS